MCRLIPTCTTSPRPAWLLQNWMKQLGFAPRNAGQVSPSGSQGCPPTDRAVALEPAHTVKLESQQNGRQHEEGAGAGAQVRGRAAHPLLAVGAGHITEFGVQSCLLQQQVAMRLLFAVSTVCARSVSSRSGASRSKGGCLISWAPAGGGHRNAPLCWQGHTGTLDHQDEATCACAVASCLQAAGCAWRRACGWTGLDRLPPTRCCPRSEDKQV